MRTAYAHRTVGLVGLSLLLTLTTAMAEAPATSAAPPTDATSPAGASASAGDTKSAAITGATITRVSADPRMGRNVMWDITPIKHPAPTQRPPAAAAAAVEATSIGGDAITPPSAVSQTGRANDCCPVGAFEDAFGFDQFLVGNVFSTTNGEVVTEIKVELDFTSTQAETLTYVIYRFNRATMLYEPQLIRDVSHIGAGQRFYSSGAINVQLMADTDGFGNTIPAFYAVGVGWDVTSIPFVVWARDNDPGGYPQVGCLNTVEGSWGFANPPPPEGDTNTLNIGTLFPNGVVSMQFCTQAIGGACCQPDGSCVNDVTQTECQTTLNGSYFGDFTLCELETCEGTGACCLGVSCQNLTEAQCAMMGGTYKGDGSDCNFIPDPCDMASNGACCSYDGSCAEISEFDCVFDPRLDTPGTFTASGVECIAANCPVLGGCCDGFSNCTDVASSGCIEFNCADTNTMGGCPAGFMLDSNGQCPTTVGGNPGECIQSTGLEWNQGEPCQHNPCFSQFSVGACCLLGDCLVSTKLVCENQGGVFTPQGINGWQACSTNGFPGLCATSNGFDRGACCLPTGCEIRDQAGCTAGGGTFLGQQIQCSSFLCSPGACCFNNMGSNACADVLPLACTTTSGLGGTFQGSGTTCPFDGCNLDAGACCGVDGTCTDVSSANCDTGSGLFTFSGVGTSCSSTFCPDTGACCNVDGTCTDVPASGCDEASGFFTYMGDSTACVTTTCAATGACCLPQPIGCIQATAADCAAGAGAFTGVGTICQGSNSCDMGTCCLVPLDTSTVGLGSCIETTRVDCAFQSDGLFNGLVTSCGLANCPVRGACCLPTGCRALTAMQCATSNGTYIGDGQACAADTCQLTACCENGVCADRFPDLCMGTRGFLGQLCSSGNLCADGACCADVLSNGTLFCITANQIECQSFGGSFGGVGSACGAGSCLEGACCAVDGSCQDPVTQLECTGQGGDFNSGQACAQVSCVDQCSAFPGIRLGDFDGDLDVDLLDFANFQLCFGTAPSAECLCIFDSNLDGAINLVDYGAFESQFTDPLPPTGKCCHLNGSCDAGVRQTDCDLFGGAVFTLGGTCAPNTCTNVCAGFTGTAPGDFDGDGDVDLLDWVDFQACFGTSPSSECMCIFDADENGVIDSATDLAAFEAAFTGP